MKKLFYLIISTTVIWTFSSCGAFEDDKPSKEKEVVKTIVELPDSIKAKIVEQDSLMTELLYKVDTLTAELNITKSENADLKQKLENLNSPNKTVTYVSVFAFILGLLAFLIALFRSKGIKEESVGDIVEKSIEKSRKIKELQVSVNQFLSSQRNNKTSNTSSSYAPNSDSRLKQLENQLSQVIDIVNKIRPQVQQSNSYRQETARTSENSEYPKVGYAKVDKDMYFTTIYESNQEGCVFRISFTSESKGKFNIIALDKIQSRNDWQKKVECIGASIKEATDFRVEEEGVCEKIDAINWIVTKPLKIRLLK